MVGLWVSDHGHGESHDIGGQQYVEQYAYIACGSGHGLVRGEGVRDNARTGCGLCSGHIRRPDGLLVR